MPISILEAMSSGNAIIASDIGEIKKNVSDAGLFIKPGDTNTLEKHMQKALKNMNILKKNAIRNFNAYTKNDVYEQNLNVIKLASRSH
jgi:glycosyltransferase involved in cell wall biosynthesis